MSNPRVVSWCPGDTCDPCSLGIALDELGNVWLPTSGKYYAPFVTPDYDPFTVSYNSGVVWSIGPGGDMHFLTNTDTGSSVLVSAGIPPPALGLYEQWICTGNILVANLLGSSFEIPESAIFTENGITYTRCAPYTGPRVDGVTALTESAPQFITLPYFHVTGGLTILPPVLYVP